MPYTKVGRFLRNRQTFDNAISSRVAAHRDYFRCTAGPSLTLFDVARFYPNPKRERGILLRSPQSENPPRRLIQRHGRERKSTVQMVSSAIPR